MHRPSNQRHCPSANTIFINYPKQIHLCNSIHKRDYCHTDDDDDDGPPPNRIHQQCLLITDSVSNTTQSMTSQFEFIYHTVLGIIFYLSCLAVYRIIVIR